jgi:hypothetical protein
LLKVLERCFFSPFAASVADMAILPFPLLQCRMSSGRLDPQGYGPVILRRRTILLKLPILL